MLPYETKYLKVLKLNEAIASAVKNTKDPVLLVGDFNYGDINWNYMEIPDNISHRNEYLFLKTEREFFISTCT